jgi:hypothetical protein
VGLVVLLSAWNDTIPSQVKDVELETPASADDDLVCHRRGLVIDISLTIVQVVATTI